MAEIKKVLPKFDIQRFRDAEDVTYRGRRRWSGNFGQVWINGEKIFEHKSCATCCVVKSYAA